MKLANQIIIIHSHLVLHTYALRATPCAQRKEVPFLLSNTPLRYQNILDKELLLHLLSYLHEIYYHDNDMLILTEMQVVVHYNNDNMILTKKSRLVLL